MINNINDLIEVYSLDKQIKDTNPVYRDFAVKVYLVYIFLSNKVKHTEIPTEELPLQDLSSIVNNNLIYVGLRDTAFYFQVADVLKEHPEVVDEEPKQEEPVEQKQEELQELAEKNAGLESELAQVSVKFNNMEMPEDLHNFIESQLSEMKVKIEDNKQALRGVTVKPVETKKEQTKSVTQKRFIFLNDCGQVVYGPCSKRETVEICKNIKYGYILREYDPNKDYSYQLMNKKDLIQNYDFHKKNDFDWVTFITIATVVATVIGMIKCYIL